MLYSAPEQNKQAKRAVCTIFGRPIYTTDVVRIHDGRAQKRADFTAVTEPRALASGSGDELRPSRNAHLRLSNHSSQLVREASDARAASFRPRQRSGPSPVRQSPRHDQLDYSTLASNTAVSTLPARLIWTKIRYLRGLFATAFWSAGRTVILYMDLQSHAWPLFEEQGEFESAVIPSLDGRRLALTRWSSANNAWMLEK